MSGFYSPSKADIYLRPLQYSSSLLFRGKDDTFLFFFYFPFSWSPSIRGLILIPSIGDEYIRWKGESQSDTFKESFLLRIYSCTDTGGGGEYILRHRWNLYVEEKLFTHIIFLPFSPNYFFLRNSVRRDDDRVFVYVPFPLKAWG